MKKKDVIKSLIREFHHRAIPDFIPRLIPIPDGLDKIITLIGPRRSGKTFRLYQIVAEILKTHHKESIIFLNLEDERLDLSVHELDLIIQAYRELYPEQDLSECTFFFDEIQNVTGWEKFIRRVYDTLSPHIFLTGSNAKMLSSEISTSLRGRSISYEIFPLSFKEYLRFNNISYDRYIPEIQAQIYNALDDYMEYGGFPELVNIQDKEIKFKILQEYYQVMLFRDLIDHYAIKNIVALKYFLKRLMASATKEISVNRIFNDLKSADIRIGKNSLYLFLDYAESIFLIRTLPKLSFKLPVREFGERKLYVIDTGLLNSLIYRFTADRGKAVENIVYWELQRRQEHIFFIKNGFECDFVSMSTDGSAYNAIQVCMDLHDSLTRKREIKGLISACRKLHLNRGTIISFDERDEITEQGINIKVIPLPQFLCENEIRDTMQQSYE